MKKIMAVGAMAAMLAGAAFAVDVSLEVQLDGSLAGYDGSAFSAVELDAWDATGSSDYIANLTVGGEKCGASVRIGNAASSSMDIQNVDLWFKPLDMLTVTAGNMWEVGSPYQTFHDWKAIAYTSGWGYKLSASVAGVTVDAVAETGKGNYWFDGSSVGGTWLKASYALPSDLGNVAVFGGTQIGSEWSWESGAYGVGLSYDIGNAWTKPYYAFASGALYLNASGELTAEEVGLYGIYKTGDFAFDVWTQMYFKDSTKVVNPEIRVEYSGIKNLGVEFEARLGNLLASSLSMDFRPAVTGNIGDMSWYAGVSAVVAPSTSKPFTFTVPVEFTLYF